MIELGGQHRGSMSDADREVWWQTLSRQFAQRIRERYPPLEFSGHREWDDGEVVDRAEEAVALVMEQGFDYCRFAAGRSYRVWLRQRLTDVMRRRAPAQFRSFWNVMKKTLADHTIFARRRNPVTNHLITGWIGLCGFPNDRLCQGAVSDWIPRWRRRVPRRLKRLFHQLSPADRRELSREMLTVVDAFMRSSDFLEGVRAMAPVAVSAEKSEEAAPLRASPSSDLPPDVRDGWKRHVIRVVDDVLKGPARRTTARVRLGWVIHRFCGRKASYSELARKAKVSHVAVGKWVKQFIARLMHVPDPVEGATQKEVLHWLLDLLQAHLERRGGFTDALVGVRAPAVRTGGAAGTRARRCDRP